MASFVASALLLSVNWITYIWTVSNGHVVDASLGYFMTPLVNVALGYFLLGERPRRAQWIALGALEGLTLKTMILAPAALTAMAWWWGSSPTSFPGPDLATDAWFLGLGPAKTIPLLLFAAAARRLSLTTLGLFQYVSPTIQFLLGIGLFHGTAELRPARRLRMHLGRACALQPRRLAAPELGASAGGDHLSCGIDDGRDPADVAQLLRRQALLLQQGVVRRDAEVALADDRRRERVGLELQPMSISLMAGTSGRTARRTPRAS